MAARLSDVAKALDINASTVSRALRDDPRVNEKTRELIKQQAEEMGYRPNLIARSLAEGKTRTVWMIVPSLSSPIEREPAEFAASALFDAGYDMLIAQHRNDRTAYKRLLNRLNEGIADGAIIIPSSDSESITSAPLVNSVPVIFLDRHPETLADKINVVTTDNEAAAYDLTRKVLESGVSSVAVFFNADNAPSHERKRGALRALAEAGVKEFSETAAAQGSVGCVASSQNDLINFSKANPGIVLGNGGTFDKWIGNISPYKGIHVCVQDFRKMADTAVKSLLSQFDGNNADVKEIVRIPYLSLTEPE